MIATPHAKRTIVVGSGIIGIACAHYLSRAGHEVTVIDRGSIGGGCSHGNCGYICPSHVLPLTEPGAIATALRSLFSPRSPFRVKPRLSPAFWNWLWQFARRCTHDQMIATGRHLKTILDSSMNEYRRLMVDEKLECQWKQNGLLYVLRTERGMKEFSESDRLLTELFGVKARRFESRDLASLEPALKPELAGAFLYEGDASVRPDLLNAHWARRLKEDGVTFIEHCDVQRIGCERGKVTSLETSRGSIDVDQTVFATGAWSPQLSAQLECRIPIEPGKGYSLTVARPNPCPTRPMLFPEDRVGVSPFDDGYRLGSIMEFAGYDTTIPECRIAQLRDSAAGYLEVPIAEQTRQTWYGWRPMTWDSLPIIGPVPRLTNAYLATGHNMLGLTLAAATGRLIAEMLEGRPTHIEAAPFSPARFERTRG